MNKTVITTQTQLYANQRTSRSDEEEEEEELLTVDEMMGAETASSEIVLVPEEISDTDLLLADEKAGKLLGEKAAKMVDADLKMLEDNHELLFAPDELEISEKLEDIVDSIVQENPMPLMSGGKQMDSGTQLIQEHVAKQDRQEELITLETQVTRTLSYSALETEVEVKNERSELGVQEIQSQV